MPDDADTILHIDMSIGDDETFERCYADAPPGEKLPYDRERLLPKSEELLARRP